MMGWMEEICPLIKLRVVWIQPLALAGGCEWETAGCEFVISV